MVLDTSAVVAILLEEPEADEFARLVAEDANVAISVVTFHEASIVMASKKRSIEAVQLVDDFVRRLEIQIISLDTEDSYAARDAYFRFGRGYHPAKLNFGDCFAYALAKVREEPLLFKGDDFAKTDVVPAGRP